MAKKASDELRQHDDVDDVAAAWFAEVAEIYEDASRDALDVVFQGRWPPQRRLCRDLHDLSTTLFGLRHSLKVIENKQATPEERTEEALCYRHWSEQFVFGVWYLGRLMEEMKAAIGGSSEWRDAYAVWCGLRLDIKNTQASFGESVISRLADTWSGPLAIVAGKLAAAGSLGPPGEEPRWSRNMKLAQVAKVFGVSNQTVSRWMKEKRPQAESIERRGKASYRVMISSLTDKERERYDRIVNGN